LEHADKIHHYSHSSTDFEDKNSHFSTDFNISKSRLSTDFQDIIPHFPATMCEKEQTEQETKHADCDEEDLGIDAILSASLTATLSATLTNPSLQA